MPQFVNFGILKHPLNWFTILLMLVIFGLGADTLLRHFSKATFLADSQTLSPTDTTE